MNFEQQNIIYLQVIKHFNDLNVLLKYNNMNLDPQKFTDCLNKRIIDLDTEDMNMYLASLLLMVFNLRNQIINIKKDSVNQLIIINFVNTVLEELNIKQIEFEVL